MPSISSKSKKERKVTQKSLASSLKQARAGLESVLDHTKLELLESERIASELNLISKRIRCSEYRRSAFNTNVLNIPDRAQELIDDLSFFSGLARIWNQILDAAKIKSGGSILDIGAGYFPKIELALHYRGFRGNVTLLDSDSKALKQAQRFLSFFDVPFKLQLRAASLFKLKPAAYDLIVANHFLDDLILAEFCKSKSITMAELYLSEQRFADSWNAIIEGELNLESLAESLAQKLYSLTTPSGGTLIILDYFSHSQASLGLTKILAYTLNFQRELKRQLELVGFKQCRPKTKIKFLSGIVNLKKPALLIMKRSS